MRPDLADDLEDFVRAGDLWDPDDLAGLVAMLEAETASTNDPVPAMLAQPFASLLVRQQLGELPLRMAHDIEGIIFPRLWKIMEALRGGLPDAEVQEAPG
jgi:hypothetical protein